MLKYEERQKKDAPRIEDITPEETIKKTKRKTPKTPSNIHLKRKEKRGDTRLKTNDLINDNDNDNNNNNNNNNNEEKSKQADPKIEMRRA
eukprot:Pgem_evm1s11123